MAKASEEPRAESRRSHRGISTQAQMATIARYRIALLTGFVPPLFRRGTRVAYVTQRKRTGGG